MILPIPASVAVIAAAGAAALGLLAGLWLGSSGARRESQADLHRQIGELSVTANTLHRRSINMLADFRAAQVQLEAVAAQLETDLAQLDTQLAARLADVESLIAAHPGWSDCSIGDDGLRAWNEAAAAVPAAAAAAGAAAQPAATLPAQPAAVARRPPAGVAAQLHAGGSPVSPLPLPTGAADRGSDAP